MSAGAATEPAPRSVPQGSPVARALRRLLRNRAFVVGAALVILLALAAIFADWIAPADPFRNNFRTRLRPPDATFWFGTDHFGRDILSRVIHGARISLLIGFCTAVLTGIAGTVIGATAGYFPRLDNPLMRVMDAMMAFPSILLAIAIAAVLGASVVNVIIALSVATTPHTARIVRASVLTLREREFVEAVRAFGAGDTRILALHIVPNAFGPLIVRLTYVFATAILAEAALSFIGVGPPPPAPSFGSIIAQGRDFIVDAPWITIFPGVAIMIAVLGLNLLGDGLRDVLDPRMRV